MKDLRPPASVRRWLRRLFHPSLPAAFRRTTPLSQVWGFDRGIPIDRYYIEKFLGGHRADIKGRTLEIADTQYTVQFGTGVSQAEVLDIDAANPKATIVADLSISNPAFDDAFDCFILTQTLQFIYDVDAAIAQAHRMLKPGGVLLATVPAVSRIAPEASHDYWRFTVDSCSRIFAHSFGAANISVTCFGNVATCTAFLQGMAFQELTQKQLTTDDAAFPLLICIRAVKAE